MRSEVTTNKFVVQDLGDQQRRPYLLVWTELTGGRTAVWIDTYTWDQGVLKGLRLMEDGRGEEEAIYEVVASLSPNFPWQIIAGDLVELITFEEHMAAERAAFPDRIRIARLMNEAKEQAERQPSIDQPSHGAPLGPGVPLNVEQFEAWYRQQKGKGDGS